MSANHNEVSIEHQDIESFVTALGIERDHEPHLQNTDSLAQSVVDSTLGPEAKAPSQQNLQSALAYLAIQQSSARETGNYDEGALYDFARRTVRHRLVRVQYQHVQRKNERERVSTLRALMIQ